MRLRKKSQIAFNVLLTVSIGGFLVLFLHTKDVATGNIEQRAMEKAETGLSRQSSPQRQQPDTKPVFTVTANDIPMNSSMRVKLIILTYMRSGSSFTGDIFNQHPEVFYVFEPLWSLEKYYDSNKHVLFRIGKDSITVKPDPKKFLESTSMSTAHLKSYLDCDFGSLDPRTLTQYHLKNSRTTNTYFRCTRYIPGIVGIVRCLPEIIVPCRKANVTVMKTIRFSMAQVAQLIEQDPKVKVLHLIRDPRGTLRSQSRVGEFKPKEVGTAAKKLCDRILDDLKESEKLKTLHKGSVLTARYEDIAMEPLKFAEKLLGFAGLKMGERERKYVWNITSAGLPDNCVICTTRKDSRKTAMSWRTKMGSLDVNLVDSSCGEVYRRMGYLPLPKHEELLNLTVPSFVDYDKVPGLWD